ncbi:hypothetical protein C0583_01270 [Candidatus Parcubacteria bacterium]|nr:MAG: hypothetical protein C0583_01270 [Candidatus Parcubacteria bacterium]
MNFTLHYTLKNEIEHARNMVSKLGWFEKNGYKIKLPNRIDINSSNDEIIKAVETEFPSANKIYTELKPQLKRLIVENTKIINYYFSLFGYNTPDTVNVYFTIYGPGGSYSPPNKISVMLNNSPNWILKMIIHETIHIIIEQPFIKKYNISHWEKEAIVDALCMSKILKNICLNYKPQKQTKKISTDLINNLNFKEKTFLIKNKEGY